ncbi:GH92 family glycosyl hydrolase [Chitinophaga sp. XS-30]|uniref:GH92 family glycosyl hydrolase n=1 Tax=Chitinophaga sp. XS-30 TaxID=2604421 RepID=UPI0011DDCA5B|nr:GH92 family glycosyl hydrolase [Chitinophaga sp. XS-30]QEH40772.1 glycoside hydrolase family 92 protein [Chitinophaga sp. XS-30]
MRIITTLSLLFFFTGAMAQRVSYVSYVDPLIGTSPATTISAMKHGAGTEHLANVIPAVGLPFGMLQLTPQTRTTEKKCQAPYYYKDATTTGYRLTHWLSGSCTQDYGSATIMPLAGTLKTSGYATPYDHKQEISAPHYYKNELDGVMGEMTATLRCGMLQFTMLRDDSLYILVTPNSDKHKGFIQVDPEKREITGYNPAYRIYQGSGRPAGFSGWFVIQYDLPAEKAGTYSGSKVSAALSRKEQPDCGAYIGLYLKKGAQLRLRIGTSFTSLEGARRNLAAEMEGKPFAAIRKQAERVWNKALGQIQVTSDNEKDKRIFYTALYHSMQHPRLMNDADGRYPRFAGDYQEEQLKQGNYYDDFSMWDTYRAQLPLFSILRPDLISDCVNSMVLKGEQGGWLPIFPCWNNYTAAMIGDHVTAFIASAYNKGIRGYDIAKAYTLMRRNAFDNAGEKDYKDGKGRRALDTYLQYGYIPLEDGVPEAFHKNEQVSRTLEYAYDDYALSTVAKALGRSEDHALLAKRALNYKFIFDGKVGLMNGRYADGRFYKDFHPDKKLSFITEGTPRQYTFYVPHDISGLGALMPLEAQLDSLFTKNEYWHGNEPGHHIPFLYNYTASPWKTQEKVAAILKEEYSDDIGGLSGNDDAGQMSAWYVFAATGLYPVDPVGGQYLLTTPVFRSVAIQLPGGKRLAVQVKPGGKYIRSVLLNGKPYTKNYITHDMLLKGGEMVMETSPHPAVSWGTGSGDQP